MAVLRDSLNNSFHLAGLLTSSRQPGQIVRIYIGTGTFIGHAGDIFKLLLK